MAVRGFNFKVMMYQKVISAPFSFLEVARLVRLTRLARLARLARLVRVG